LKVRRNVEILKNLLIKRHKILSDIFVELNTIKNQNHINIILRIKLKRLVYNAQENIIASGLKLSTPTIKGILTEMIGLGNQNAQNSLKTLIDEGL